MSNEEYTHRLFFNSDKKKEKHDFGRIEAMLNLRLLDARANALNSRHSTVVPENIELPKQEQPTLTEFMKGAAYFDILMQHKVDEILNSKPIILK